MKPIFIALALATGCSTIVPSTVARFYALSPLEADPKDIAVALDLPDGIGITENSAQLNIRATRSDTGATSDQTYILASKQGSNGSLIYAVSTMDFARLRAQQTLVQSWKDEADDATKGSVGVTLAGCAQNEGPADDAIMSINIRTQEGSTFFPLIRNAPVADVLDYTEIEALQPCA